MQEVSDGHRTPPILTSSGGDKVVANSERRAGIWAEILRYYPDSSYAPDALAAEDGTGDKYALVYSVRSSASPRLPSPKYCTVKCGS